MLNYSDTAAYFAANNRLDEAKQILRRAFDSGMDSVNLRGIQNIISFLEGDMSTVQRNLDWARGRVGSGNLFLGRSAMAIYYGKTREAQGFLRQAVEEAKSNRSPKRGADYLAEVARTQASVGNLKESKVLVQEALALDESADTKGLVALSLSRADDSAKVLKTIDLLNKEFPQDTLIQSWTIPMLRSVTERDPVRAVDDLERARSVELGGAHPRHGPGSGLRARPGVSPGEARCRSRDRVPEDSRTPHHCAIVYCPSPFAAWPRPCLCAPARFC